MKRFQLLFVICFSILALSCHNNDEKLNYLPSTKELEELDTLSISQNIGVYSILDTTYFVESKILYGNKIVFSSYKKVSDDSLNYVKEDLKKKMEKAKEIIYYMKKRGVNNNMSDYLSEWFDNEVDKDDLEKTK